MARGLTPKRFQSKTNTVRRQTFKPYARLGEFHRRRREMSSLLEHGEDEIIWKQI